MSGSSAGPALEMCPVMQDTENYPAHVAPRGYVPMVVELPVDPALHTTVLSAFKACGKYQVFKLFKFILMRFSAVDDAKSVHLVLEMINRRVIHTIYDPNDPDDLEGRPEPGADNTRRKDGVCIGYRIWLFIRDEPDVLAFVRLSIFLLCRQCDATGEDLFSQLMQNHGDEEDAPPPPAVNRDRLKVMAQSIRMTRELMESDAPGGRAAGSRAAPKMYFPTRVLSSVLRTEEGQRHAMGDDSHRSMWYRMRAGGTLDPFRAFDIWETISMWTPIRFHPIEHMNISQRFTNAEGERNYPATNGRFFPVPALTIEVYPEQWPIMGMLMLMHVKFFIPPRLVDEWSDMYNQLRDLRRERRDRGDEAEAFDLPSRERYIECMATQATTSLAAPDIDVLESATGHTNKLLQHRWPELMRRAGRVDDGRRTRMEQIREVHLQAQEIGLAELDACKQRQDTGGNLFFSALHKTALEICARESMQNTRTCFPNYGVTSDGDFATQFKRVLEIVGNSRRNEHWVYSILLDSLTVIGDDKCVNHIMSSGPGFGKSEVIRQIEAFDIGQLLNVQHLTSRFADCVEDPSMLYELYMVIDELTANQVGAGQDSDMATMLRRLLTETKGNVMRAVQDSDTLRWETRRMPTVSKLGMFGCTNRPLFEMDQPTLDRVFPTFGVLSKMRHEDTARPTGLGLKTPEAREFIEHVRVLLAMTAIVRLNVKSGILFDVNQSLTETILARLKPVMDDVGFDIKNDRVHGSIIQRVRVHTTFHACCLASFAPVRNLLFAPGANLGGGGLGAMVERSAEASVMFEDSTKARQRARAAANEVAALGEDEIADALGGGEEEEEEEEIDESVRWDLPPNLGGGGGGAENDRREYMRICKARRQRMNRQRQRAVDAQHRNAPMQPDGACGRDAQGNMKMSGERSAFTERTALALEPLLYPTFSTVVSQTVSTIVSNINQLSTIVCTAVRASFPNNARRLLETNCNPSDTVSDFRRGDRWMRSELEAHPMDTESADGYGINPNYLTIPCTPSNRDRPFLDVVALLTSTNSTKTGRYIPEKPETVEAFLRQLAKTNMMVPEWITTTEFAAFRAAFARAQVAGEEDFMDAIESFLVPSTEARSAPIVRVFRERGGEMSVGFLKRWLLTQSPGTVLDSIVQHLAFPNTPMLRCGADTHLPEAAFVACRAFIAVLSDILIDQLRLLKQNVDADLQRLQRRRRDEERMARMSHESSRAYHKAIRDSCALQESVDRICAERNLMPALFNVALSTSKAMRSLRIQLDMLHGGGDKKEETEIRRAGGTDEHGTRLGVCVLRMPRGMTINALMQAVREACVRYCVTRIDSMWTAGQVFMDDRNFSARDLKEMLVEAGRAKFARNKTLLSGRYYEDWDRHGDDDEDLWGIRFFQEEEGEGLAKVEIGMPFLQHMADNSFQISLSGIPVEGQHSISPTMCTFRGPEPLVAHVVGPPHLFELLDEEGGQEGMAPRPNAEDIAAPVMEVDGAAFPVNALSRASSAADEIEREINRGRKASENIQSRSFRLSMDPDRFSQMMANLQNAQPAGANIQLSRFAVESMVMHYNVARNRLIREEKVPPMARYVAGRDGTPVYKESHLHENFEFSNQEPLEQPRMLSDACSAMDFSRRAPGAGGSFLEDMLTRESILRENSMSRAVAHKAVAHADQGHDQMVAIGGGDGEARAIADEPEGWANVARAAAGIPMRARAIEDDMQ